MSANHDGEGSRIGRTEGQGLAGKLGEAEVNLVEVFSNISTRDKELADLKETMKNREQVFYNMGFKDTENSAGAVIF